MGVVFDYAKCPPNTECLSPPMTLTGMDETTIPATRAPYQLHRWIAADLKVSYLSVLAVKRDR